MPKPSSKPPSSPRVELSLHESWPKSPAFSWSGSGIEIKSIGEGYSMQVRFGLAWCVLSFVPEEIEAPPQYAKIHFSQSSPKILTSS
jgi:hypothetical protein